MTETPSGLGTGVTEGGTGEETRSVQGSESDPPTWGGWQRNLYRRGRPSKNVGTLPTSKTFVPSQTSGVSGRRLQGHGDGEKV